jgi:phospholipase C
MKHRKIQVLTFVAVIAAVTSFLMTSTPAKSEEKKPAKVTLKVVKVDSEETSSEDGKGANAVDGNTETFWHTQWGDDNPATPHEIIIQLDPATKIKGVTYLPRQDGGDHGNIKEYEVYVSTDGKEFGKPVAKGTWENNADKKTATFDATKCGFIKLKALSEVNGEAWTSAAEIDVVPVSD